MKKVVAVILAVADVVLLAVIIFGFVEYKTEESIREELAYSAELYEQLKTEKAQEKAGEGQGYSDRFLLGEPLGTTVTENKAPEMEKTDSAAPSEIDLGLGIEPVEPVEIPADEELPFEIAGKTGQR